MKKFISFSLVAMLGCYAFAQDTNSKEEQTKKKSSEIKAKENVKANSLDGRSFKVTFTERQAEVKPVPQLGILGTTDSKTIEKPVSDYSVFDANSKVMLTFSDGKILSPILMDDGCPYHVNVSGTDMYAFSSYCRMNTGNKKSNTETSMQDSKMEMDAANANQSTSAGSTSTEPVQPAVTAPPDETKQHLPPGVAHSDNADLNTPPAGNTPPVIQSEDIQRQSETPVKNLSGSMATISGVVHGNAISGTLSWTASDGRKINYAFSGSAATKKDLNDSQVVGMK